jgi:hypothetical protein
MAFSVLSPRGLVTPVGGVGSREAAVKPTWMDSRRPSAGVTRPRKNETTKCNMYRARRWVIRIKSAAAFYLGSYAGTAGPWVTRSPQGEIPIARGFSALALSGRVAGSGSFGSRDGCRQAHTDVSTASPDGCNPTSARGKPTQEGYIPGVLRHPVAGPRRRGRALAPFGPKQKLYPPSQVWDPASGKQCEPPTGPDNSRAEPCDVAPIMCTLLGHHLADPVTPRPRVT